MRQVVEFGIGQRKGVILGANLELAILTNGDLYSVTALFPNYFGLTLFLPRSEVEKPLIRRR